jgi:uncharacterized protein
MLLVKTYLDVTDGKGIGLFSAEPIAAGTVWWRYEESFDRTISKADADRLRQKFPLMEDFFHTHGAMREDGSWCFCADSARFVNHSDNPNTKPIDGVAADGDGDWVAARDIAVGEELTSDYRQVCLTCRDGLPFENKEMNSFKNKDNVNLTTPSN